MPAMLDDPTSPAIKRDIMPVDFAPRHVTLKDETAATILPFTSLAQVPPSLVAYLCSQLALEIEKGDTYPLLDPLPVELFGPYWFGLFGAIMFIGELNGPEDVLRMGDADWTKVCLGSFYIKPNYPGRSSHVCNAGFLVTEASRNRGVGKLMGQAYLEWAPKLVSLDFSEYAMDDLLGGQGYSYSVFNLVYETNVASCRIWDSLGFERIGRVKKCGKLRSSPGKRVDSIVFGYDFEPEKSE
jgi:RimJ/RimL family protein N-acetyltransferase